MIPKVSQWFRKFGMVPKFRMVWICVIIPNISKYFRRSEYFRKALAMLPKHLTLNVERRLETTVETPTICISSTSHVQQIIA